MPTQINGIGTSYVGRSNSDTYQGACSSCGAYTTLKSYETGYWFTIFFVPVIPLGRKQIVDYCSNCTAHRSIKLAEWQNIREETLNSSLDELTENRDDPQAALKLHGAYVTFNQTNEAHQLADVMRGSFADDVEVLLYLGSWFEQVGKKKEADECFAHAFKLAPGHPGTRQAVGIGMVEQGRLNDARELFTVFEPPSENYDPALFVFLATSYQAANDHARAYELFRMLLKATPELGNDKSFRKMVRSTEAALAVKPSLVRSEPIYTPNKYWAVGLAAAVLVGILLGNWYIASNRTLHIVNGLTVPLKVDVDEIHVEVPAGRVRQIKLSEGSHAARLVEPAGLVAPFDFEMKSGWWMRYFRTPVFVLDPSQASVVLWEETVYSEQHVNRGTNYEMHIGQPLTYVKHADYFFQNFPRQLRVEGRSRVVKKSRVILVDANPLDVGRSVPNATDQSQLMGTAERRIVADPGNEQNMSLYVLFAMQQDELQRCYAFLEKGLSRRPIEVDWHRMFQSVCGMLDKDVDLRAKYDTMLQANPQASSLLYLRGRLEAQSSRAFAYYDRAIQGAPESVFAWGGKGYHLLGNGKFEEAFVMLDKAHEIQPDRLQLAGYRRDVQSALKRFEGLEKELRARINQNSTDLYAAQSLIQLYIAQNDPETAQKVERQYKISVANTPYERQAVAHVRAAHYYARQEFEKMLSVARATDGLDMWEFAGYLETSNLESATKALDAINDNVRSQYQICMAIAHLLRGETEESREWTRKAISQMRRDAPSKYAVDLLQRDAENPVTSAEAHDFGFEPQFKSALLVLLALRSEKDRGPILDLAEKLNFKPSFPCFFLRRAIEATRDK